ncbi:hypothetical protein K469DRAFT_641684 [Zopfia rhizophila CBS 207.26]|uniref:Protein EFR3 n=1 Tax=Zopfia rhizophila CBS 207.26 TaxID=1314779 RepID=A0A6A6DN33_9PEZI|nr:hypothetical protein K469DRAFT_641684 [Zopfia rhizophila CBS 207.26]
MNAARQACRPKHQVLVLKCYPKFQKNNVEVKANSSELSYLLYYASTRRSKLQKVGDFLDKRTIADVWKGRIGNVQVTLEILKALIEKCPRDLPLYAGAMLRILRTILKSNDVTMVEESVPTFETLCAHQDPANLAADQDYIKQYGEVVQLYAQFASKEVVNYSKTPISWPVAIRFRKAGLRALKGVASSESLESETGRQLAVIIPVILLNVYSESGDYLKRLESREQERDEHEKEQALRRRQSISTVRTDNEEGDPIAASGTTEDADKLAEEEVGVVALQALRNIFLGVNRGQLRLATSAVLQFIGSHVKPQGHFSTHGNGNDSWPTTLLAMICGWAPVQDRYAILVGAVESLVRSPIVEQDLGRQLVLATVIDYLLSSTINFIGLSVMDVLIGLMSHTLLLLQLVGSGTTVMPHHQQTTTVASEKDLKDPKSSESIAGGVVVELVKEPSRFRLELLVTLQKCMASLATHVYYTDQISDMVAAILARLKPSPTSGVSNTAAAIEDPAGAVDAVASSASLQEKAPHVDKFFSFETARLTALEAVKGILITANTRRPDGSSAPVSRGSVGVRVWEGTQWLLRDPSGKVRKAYTDALITWLNLEKGKEDLIVVEDYRKKDKENNKGGLARRAVSNASNRERSPKRVKNTFLALLHLSIYDNAHQYVDSEPDLLLLHLLLTTLVNKLGVNAARSGLPMILRLQEDIQSIDGPGSKIRIGSLVHGYLWALSMALEFETSSVGRALHAEISKRNDKGLWVKSIRVPPMPLERIELPLSGEARNSTEIVQTEALKPFDNRGALVDKIAAGYSSSLYSPPSSPPGSPGRSMSMPIIAPATLKPPPQLPSEIREELLSDWTKDLCIASNTKDSSAASMTGSRTGTSGHRVSAHQKNNFLGITIPNGGLDSINNSPLPTPRRAHSRPPSTAYGLVGRLHSPHRNHSPSGTPGSTPSVRSAVRVEDLKRVLSGSAPRTSYSIRPASHYHRDSDREADSSASESMVSVHSLSDASFVTAEHGHPNPLGSHNPNQPPDSPATPAATLTPRPLTSHPPNSSPPTPHSPHSPTHAARERDVAFASGNVPPVPPIPASLRENSVSPSPKDRPKTAPSSSGNGNGSTGMRKSRSLKRGAVGARSVNEGSGSRGRAFDGSTDRRPRTKKPDFTGFLDSIGVEGDHKDGAHGVGKAPY